MYIVFIISLYIINVTHGYMYWHDHGKYETYHWNQHNHSAPLIVISWPWTISHHIRMSNTLVSHNLYYRMIQNNQNNMLMTLE